MQYMANLSDQGAAEAVAARIDWKYALGTVTCEKKMRLPWRKLERR
jgi:hypothetical protein